MNERVLYRKYRPAQWGEVLGQPHIVAVLKTAAEEHTIAHAYLFSGSRGTGKTSVARIFAAAIDCTPTDLYEIDAASNRGIDDVRELRDAVSTLPFESPYKVYLIDEVHMLTKEAFNALLKTLEEPPSHVIFILATTELSRVPETIISRCQSFVFKKPSREELVKHVSAIAKKEGAALGKDAAALIALLGDGSFRDALGVLQKVMTVSLPSRQAGKDKELSADEVARVTGAPKAELVRQAARALAEADADTALAAVSTALEGNVDMKVFARLVMHTLRETMLLIFAKDLAVQIKEGVSSDEYAFLAELGKSKGAKRLPEILRELLAAYPLIDASPAPALPLELAIIKLSGQDK